jgi:hypothetical protein
MIHEERCPLAGTEGVVFCCANSSGWRLLLDDVQVRFAILCVVADPRRTLGYPWSDVAIRSSFRARSSHEDDIANAAIMQPALWSVEERDVVWVERTSSAGLACCEDQTPRGIKVRKERDLGASERVKELSETVNVVSVEMRHEERVQRSARVSIDGRADHSVPVVAREHAAVIDVAECLAVAKLDGARVEEALADWVLPQCGPHVEVRR